MAVKEFKKSSQAKLSKDFKVKEFACKGNGCCEKVKIDTELAEYLQKIRDHFGVPVVINSAYRCTLHNRVIGGASKSKHLSGMAADIAVKGIKPSEVAKYAESIGILGIGLYETASDGYFVHIDTRKNKSFWYSQKQIYRSTFGGALKKSYTGVFPKLPVRGYLKKGDSGIQVMRLQRFLNWYGGYELSVDGEMGPLTVKSVKVFQKKEGLKSDGLFGSESLKKAVKIQK